MRGISLLLLGATLASCTDMPEQPIRSARGQQEFQMLVAGKSPRAQLSCLPNYSANDMTVIDGRTLAFRRGTGTVYVMHLTPGCEMVGSGTYALLSRQYGGTGVWRGGIQPGLRTMNRITIGRRTGGGSIP